MKKIFGRPYLYILGALAGAANGLFGSGGGIITVPMLEHDGVNPKKAHATSIAITLPLSVISGIIYFSKGSLDLREALKYIPFGVLGALIGSRLLTGLSSRAIKKLFAAVMIAFGVKLMI